MQLPRKPEVVSQIVILTWIVMFMFDWHICMQYLLLVGACMMFPVTATEHCIHVALNVVATVDIEKYREPTPSPAMSKR